MWNKGQQGLPRCGRPWVSESELTSSELNQLETKQDGAHIVIEYYIESLMAPLLSALTYNSLPHLPGQFLCLAGRPVERYLRPQC